MKLKIKLTLLFALLISILYSQDLPDKYYVQFTDKNNSPYSVDNPEEFLSQRAIERRLRQGIPVDEKDLPVNPQYLQGVKNAGAQLLFPTKWLNGATVIITGQDVIDAVESLPYVSEIKLITYLSVKGKKSTNKKSFFDNERFEPYKKGDVTGEKSSLDYDYGAAYAQINLINGIPLHNAGYRGQGMVIAILDAGFENVPTQPLFDSLRANGQILGTKDFVTPGGNVYTGHSHGRKVLSTMGANQPGVMIGTAPKASYWLLRPENPAQEYVAEEYNWVSAAEFADSAGADIINSSLGYIDFEDPSQDHTYEQLDGNTAIVTIGADMAASRGLVVCNSAGNSGGNWWDHLGFPADGDSVFTVGAVDNNGNYASFSSPGPTYDGRIKPNVVATGSGTTVADGGSGVTYGSGTSFSSPITAGMVACIWQAMPDMNNMEIMWAIMESGSLSDDPNNKMGWGIPDYQKALGILTAIDSNKENNDHIIAEVYPNPFTTTLSLKLKKYLQDPLSVTMTDITGKIVYSRTFGQPGFYVGINDLDSQLKQGIYVLEIRTQDNVQTVKIVKQ